MAGTTDFLPFATGSSANVETQASYAADSTTTDGFQSGTASSAKCNKVWRQATMGTAVIANFTAGQLSINVADDGSVTNFVSNFTDALNALIASNLTTYATIPYASSASNLSTGTLPAARLPSSFTVTGTITAGAFNVSSDRSLKTDIKPIEGALERLNLWRGVTFRWKLGGVQAAGIIAQDFLKARPEGVHEVNGRLVVDPMAVIAELREALGAEIHARRALEARIAALESA